MTEPNCLRSTYGEPKLEPLDGADETDRFALFAGWDLSFGCKLSVGPDLDYNELAVTVSMSDQALRNGIEVRAVTELQLLTFASELVWLVAQHKGPHPAGSEMTRMAVEIVADAVKIIRGRKSTPPGDGTHD